MTKRSISLCLPEGSYFRLFLLFLLVCIFMSLNNTLLLLLLDCFLFCFRHGLLTSLCGRWYFNSLSHLFSIDIHSSCPILLIPLYFVRSVFYDYIFMIMKMPITAEPWLLSCNYIFLFAFLEVNCVSLLLLLVLFTLTTYSTPHGLNLLSRYSDSSEILSVFTFLKKSLWLPAHLI